MASQMQNISEASLQVQMKFADQMTYQRQRDLRFNEISELSILKQHEMVQCFRELTAVLGAVLAAGNTATANAVEGPGHTGSTFRSASLPMYSAEGLNAGSMPMHAAVQQPHGHAGATVTDHPGTTTKNGENM